MNEKYRALQTVNKRCYRTIVVDSSRDCNNGCGYCFSKSFDAWRQATVRRSGAISTLDMGTLRDQLRGNTELRRELDKYRVVRIGALCDIKRGDTESYELTREAMQMIWAHGYKYMLVTKSAHSVDTEMLRDMKRHDAMISVTAGYYRSDHATLFEDMRVVPVEDRRDLLRRAIDIGIHNTLRLNPIHPHYVDSALSMVEWYKSVGGERVIVELLRVDPRWKANMPKVSFDDYVTIGNGGFYRGYLTPHRDLADKLYTLVVGYARRIGLDKITICADIEANMKYGYRGDTIDCCQACDIWDIPRPVLEE
jgi:DNA repair photolyase